MPFLTTLGLLAGAGSAVKGFIDGSQMKSRAESNLKKFQHQELTNLADALKPSKEAEMQAISQIDKSRATFADVAQTMDAASAMAILGRGQEQLSAQEQKVFSSILDKDFQADLARVQDDQTRRQMIEARKMEELQSLKQEAQAGAEMQMGGITDLASLAITAGQGQTLEETQAGIESKKARQSKREARKLNDKGFLGKNTKVGGLLRTAGSFLGGAPGAIINLVGGLFGKG